MHIAGKIRLNDGNNNVLVGSSWGSLTTASSSVAVGYQALTSLTTGGNNTAVGAEALLGNSTGQYNAALGFAAARLGSRSNDVSLGYRAGIYGAGTSGNVSIGYRASEYTDGNDNVLIGNQAGFGASDSNFGQTVAVGAFALRQLTTGTQNVSVGYEAGNNLTTGGSNVLIGYKAGSTLTTESNKLYIENSNSATPLIYGDFASSTRRVGIEESSPQSTFHVKDEASIGKNGGDTGRLILRSSGGPTVEFTGTGTIDTTTGSTEAGLTFVDTTGFEGKQRFVSFSPGTSGKIFVQRSAHATHRGGLVVQQQTSISTNGNEIFVTANSDSSVIQSRGFGGTGVAKDMLFKIGGNSNNANDTETEVMRITNASASSPYSVGIGTSTPDEKLHVAGQIKIDNGSNPYTFPAADGSANQILRTNGSGTLSFQTLNVTSATGNELENVVEDTTPQLGGNLDVNGNTITSNTGGDVVIQPDGTGSIILKSDDIKMVSPAQIVAGQIKLGEAPLGGTNFVSLKAPLLLNSDVTFTLPSADGSANQILKTNGAGTLSFADGFSPTNGTVRGVTNVKDAGATRGQIAFFDNAEDNFITLKAPDVLTSNTAFVLPEDGNADQVLKTDGSGNLSFSTVSSILGNLIGTRKFTKTTNTPGDSEGDVVFLGGTTSMTTGALYQYQSNGTWALADADSATTCDGLLGIALGASSDNDGVLLRGMVTIDHDPGALGDVLFASTTAGDITATAPSGTGDIVRVVGYCLDASNGQIWFNPDGTFVEVA